MNELNITPNFTIDDIHRVREYNYEFTKNMSKEERRAHYSTASEKARKRMHELKANKGE